MTVVNHIQFDSRVHPVFSEKQHSQSCHRHSNKTKNHRKNGIHQGKYQYYSNAIIMIFYDRQYLSACYFSFTYFIDLFFSRRSLHWSWPSWQPSAVVNLAYFPPSPHPRTPIQDYCRTRPHQPLTRTPLIRSERHCCRPLPVPWRLLYRRSRLLPHASPPHRSRPPP